MPDALRPRVFDRLERKFDLMQELGADLLLVCSNVSPRGDRRLAARIVADLAKLGERAARRGLRVGYEALAWGRHVNDHREAWAIVARSTIRRSASILDSFHRLAAAFRSRACARSIRRGSSSSSSPTRRCCRWTSSPGAAISATCRGRATCRSSTMSAALLERSATTGR